VLHAGNDDVILLAADWETFFSKDYTLTKLTTEAYVRDARFMPIGLGVVCPEVKYKQFLRPEHIAPWCAAWEKKVGWKNTQLLTHHAQFDGLIFAHHFGVLPGLHLDTLSMARVQLGVHLSASLDALAKYYGLPSKNVPYNEFKGVLPSQIPPGLFDRIARGCLHDTFIALEVFSRLLVGFPRQELETIDTTIRMFTEPALAADFTVLKDLWLSENKRRYGALAELGVTDKEINSDATFIQLLEAEGIEIVYKDGKNGPIPAFAKNDEFMEELLEHQNPRVCALATSRLGLRSTIDQTRAERLGSMASRGPLCVYLGYGRAHTTRWGGGDKTNFQNLRRGGKLRKAIVALPGTELVVADASQIEARVLATFAGEETLVDKFRSGGDPYVEIASIAYGQEVTKADKAMRGTGKQLILSCGYGAGDATIQKTARLGVYGPPVIIDIGEARRWKEIYRSTYRNIEQVWKEADGVIARMFNYQSFEWRCLDVECDPDFVHPNGTVGKRRVRLPGELPLIYDSLEWSIPSDEILARFPSLKPGWQVKTRKGFPTRMYGAKLIENVVQYMARMHLRTAMNEIRRHGIKIATTTHDELVAVVAVDKSAWAKDIMDRAMCTAPWWMPELPLGVESSIVTCYGDSK
jgi:hypothetical protein